MVRCPALPQVVSGWRRWRVAPAYIVLIFTLTPQRNGVLFHLVVMPGMSATCATCATCPPRCGILLEGDTYEQPYALRPFARTYAKRHKVLGQLILT